MSYSPYDWNQSIQLRMEYTEERLSAGSPVVAISRPEGLFLLSVHRTTRKVYEIYDHIAYAGLGNQSDIETMRTASIDFCHREGYQRSPDDVTAARLVGTVLSGALKRAFGDPFTAPFVFHGLFAELGEAPGDDRFFTLQYDGEFRQEDRFSVVAGTLNAENQMIELLHAELNDDQSLDEALKLALRTWAVGKVGSRTASITGGENEEEATEESGDAPDPAELLREELKTATLEVGQLVRDTPREGRFRLWSADETAALAEEYREE